MEIAIIDLEATSLNPSYLGSIVDIGIAKIDLNTGQITKLFDSLVKEDRFNDKKIEHYLRKSWIFQNTSLKYEDVLEADSLNSKRGELQSIFNTYPLTAFNKKFDFSFLRYAGFQIKYELPCPMIILTDIMKIPFYGGKYKYPNFMEAWNYFFPNTSHKELHSAYDDTYHEALVVYEMYKKKIFPLNIIEHKKKVNWEILKPENTFKKSFYDNNGNKDKETENCIFCNSTSIYLKGSYLKKGFGNFIGICNECLEELSKLSDCSKYFEEIKRAMSKNNQYEKEKDLDFSINYKI